jgi:hypothetical protein
MITRSGLCRSLKTHSWLGTVLLLSSLGLVGCSRVNILQPADGAVFPAGQPIQFVGEVTRSTETGGEDRSNQLEWDSNRDGHLASGQQFTTSTLSTGSHKITANWGTKDRRASINISVSP